MNLIQKLYALLVSQDVNVWHFHSAKGKQFFYWLVAEPDNKEGYAFATLEEMIEAAYVHIDPLRQSLPPLTNPTEVRR